MKPTCITQPDNKNLLAFKLTRIGLQNVVLNFLIEIYYASKINLKLFKCCRFRITKIPYKKCMHWNF